jgi:hypothetical protein
LRHQDPRPRRQGRGSAVTASTAIVTCKRDRGYSRLPPHQHHNGTVSRPTVPSISPKKMCGQKLTPKGVPFLLSCHAPQRTGSV